MKVNMFGM